MVFCVFRIFFSLISSCYKLQCLCLQHHSSQSQGLHHMGRQVVRLAILFCHSRIASWAPWLHISNLHLVLLLVGTREIPVCRLSTMKRTFIHPPGFLTFNFLFCRLSTESSSVLSGRSHDLNPHPQDHPILGKTSSGPPALDMSRVGSGSMPSSLPPSSRIDSLSSSREPSSSQMELPVSRIEPPSVSQVSRWNRQLYY